jgi:hypothetical protein
MITLDQAIDTINQLSFEEQELLVDILYKRLIEARRHKMAQQAQESLLAYRQGQFKAQPADDALVELHESLEDYDA